MKQPRQDEVNAVNYLEAKILKKHGATILYSVHGKKKSLIMINVIILTKCQYKLHNLYVPV